MINNDSVADELYELDFIEIDSDEIRDTTSYTDNARPFFYSEGEDLDELREFLTDLSVKSALTWREFQSDEEGTTEQRYHGTPVHGFELAEELRDLNPEGGYNLAFIRNDDMVLPDHMDGQVQIYARISEDLPRNAFDRVRQKDFDLKDGIAINGSDRVKKDELHRLARRNYIEEIRYTQRIRNKIIDAFW